MKQIFGLMIRNVTDNILTQSIGSGIEGRFTIYNRTYEKDPVKKGDFIFCDRYIQEGRYFELAAYHHL